MSAVANPDDFYRGRDPQEKTPRPGERRVCFLRA
jgi:hypothetical protein